MKAINIKTEYLHNPIGLGTVKPRITWNCDGGQKQTAYYISAVVDGKECSSGKVESDSMHADFGVSLASRSRVNFKIKLWDENGREGEWSEENSFEIGLFEKSDWQAKWISGGYKADKKKRYPVDCFKKDSMQATPQKHAFISPLADSTRQDLTDKNAVNSSLRRGLSIIARECNIKRTT